MSGVGDGGGRASSPTKLAVQDHIASRLGWEHLRDTYRTEREFNIWMFHDPTHEIRKATSQRVELKYGASLA